MGLMILNRAQIWTINLEPTKGSEIKKIRPCVIVSTDAIKRLPVKLVVPLTEWQESFKTSQFHVPVEVTDAVAYEAAGLKKFGAADVLQTRCVSTDRFVKFVATMTAPKMQEIVAALAAVVEYV